MDVFWSIGHELADANWQLLSSNLLEELATLDRRCILKQFRIGITQMAETFEACLAVSEESAEFARFLESLGQGRMVEEGDCFAGGQRHGLFIQCIAEKVSMALHVSTWLPHDPNDPQCVILCPLKCVGGEKETNWK